MNWRYARAGARAGHRCEYCRAPEAVFNLSFEVEHIIPVSLGGLDEEDNWALSCRACNLHKGAVVEVFDRQTGHRVRLFHPRRDQWEAHFRVDPETSQIIGLTPIGRATVAQLRINSPLQLDARRQWQPLGLFPPS